MNPELKHSLDVLRAELEKSHGQQLWAVLTALRGPDFEESDDIKDCTTAVLRQQAFGVGVASKFGAICRADTQERAEGRRTFSAANSRHTSHFFSHIFSAFSALGLSWRDVNPEPKDE